MIVVDTSALIAILFEEPEKQAFENVITGGERCVMSAVNCAAYALAKTMKAPLLFKGDDFAQTDLQSCL